MIHLRHHFMQKLMRRLFFPTEGQQKDYKKLVFPEEQYETITAEGHYAYRQDYDGNYNPNVVSFSYNATRGLCSRILNGEHHLGMKHHITSHMSTGIMEQMVIMKQ